MLAKRYTPAALLCVSLLSMIAPAQKVVKHPATATTAPAPAASSAAMTNDDVITLAGLGLSDDVVIAKIHAAPAASFDTSVAGLKALKAGGVSSAVIRYMIDPTAPTAPPPPAAAVVANNPDDPAAPHSPGVYILATGKDGAVHLSKLDHITGKTTKTSGAFLSSMTYGIAKGHVKAAVDGAHATVQTTEANPVFYAFIPEDNNTFGGASISVRDLTLIKFDPKESSREINMGNFSPWGSSTGADAKAKQGFAAEQVRTGVYKMTLDRALLPGQYAFQHQNFGAFFDFGIIPAQ